MTQHNFVHLHVHTHYSLLDGAASVANLVETAKRYKMPAIAITDHGNMFGAIEMYESALKRGIKPIIGFEAYLTPGSRHDKVKDSSSLYHLVLLAKNLEGYKNIVKLSSLSYTEGFYYKPRVDFELLETYNEGIIALSACLAGEIPQFLLKDDKDKAIEAVKRYQSIFGKENFYVEIQNHGIEEQIKILDTLVEVARLCDAPIVATNDSHYVEPEDWEAQDALLCLSTNAKIDEVDRFRFETREFYFKSPAEMAKLFEKYPDAISNTLEIAERCNLKLDLNKPVLPHFQIPEGKTSESYLTELCNEGLKHRYPEVTTEVYDRLEFELSVIKKMGFCDYFLIVWDVINQARKMGVPVGPGRGSAAGSIVAYLTRITDIEPLKYGLLFERFLNPDRISMPDIDIDFSDEGREEVIEYVREKYGRKQVAQIATFNLMLAKMAIRDVGRVMGMPLSEVDKIAKMVPEKPNTHLYSALKEVPELRDIQERGTPEQRKLIKIAATVDGLVRHTGLHACGIVISHSDLTDVVPLYLDKSKEVATQYEKSAIEKVGLLKMDFLGLKTLTILKRAIDNIKLAQSHEVELDTLAYDDQKTYELLHQGLTLGVFQLESSGMRSLVVKLKPSVFEDLIALLAIYRPGPLGSGMVEDFVNCKHLRKEIVYPHPDLEPVLKDTYGVFLYQEQVMRTANVLANFSMSDADLLRKAMGKKIPDIMEKLGKQFVEGAVARGVSKEKAQEIFDLMASFGEYGFNKSHSAAYALITYRTAYLKAHYPVEFMAAVLSSELDNTDKLAKYIAECRVMDIEILPPDVNKSDYLFKVEAGKIRFGLGGLKGMGAGPAEAIVNNRLEKGSFKNIGDLTRRIDTSQINIRTIEALIKSGALDCFNLKKSQLLEVAPAFLKSAQAAQKNKNAGQATFFEFLGDDQEGFGDFEIQPPDIPELTLNELLMYEKEVFGFYLTGDPFAEMAPLGRLFYTHNLSDLNELPDGATCRIAGQLTSCKKRITKKGDYMASITIDSDKVSQEVTIFPSAYKNCQQKLVVDQPLFMLAKVQRENDEVKIFAEKVFTLADLSQTDFTKINLLIPPDCSDKNNYQALLSLLQKHGGSFPFLLSVVTKNKETVTIKPPAKFKINFSPSLIDEWESKCGKHSFKAEFNETKYFQSDSSKIRRMYNGSQS